MAPPRGRRPPSPNRIAQFRRQHGLTQQQLAERLDIHWITISRLENGRQSLTWEWAEKLGAALGVNPLDLLAPSPRVAQIGIVGIVTPSGSALTYEEGNRPKRIVSSAVFDDPNSFFVLAEGNAPGGLFRDGDLLRFSYVNAEQYDHCVGRFCMVWGARDLESNLEREVFTGVVERGSRRGTCSLYNWGYHPISDVHIEALAMLTMAMMPEPGRRLVDVSPSTKSS